MTKYCPRTAGTHNKGGTRNPAQWEVWWVKNLKFDGGNGGKDRPVIVVRVDGEYVDFYECTTQQSAFRRRYYLLDPTHAGLDKDGYVDLKTHRIPKDRLDRRMGRLCDEDIQGLQDSVRYE